MEVLIVWPIMWPSGNYHQGYHVISGPEGIDLTWGGVGGLWDLPGVDTFLKGDWYHDRIHGSPYESLLSINTVGFSHNTQSNVALFSIL